MNFFSELKEILRYLIINYLATINLILSLLFEHVFSNTKL